MKRTRLKAAAVVALLIACGGCSPSPKPRETTIETTLEGKGGIYSPGFGFLYLQTEERDSYSLARGASLADLDLYRGVVLQGLEIEAPKSILGRRKLAATTSLMLEQQDSPLAVPIVPDLFRYDYAVCQGLLREGRAELFGAARGWQSGGVVALPLWTAGAASPDEDWALLYLENGALATLPRPGVASSPMGPPLAAGTVKRSGDQVVQAAVGAMGTLVAEMRRSGALEVLGTDGTSVLKEPVTAWDVAWHPKLPLLYAAGPRGVFVISASGGQSFKARVSMPGNVPASSLSVSTDGAMMILSPAGGAAKLMAVALGLNGEPEGAVSSLPHEAAAASRRVWEPESHVLWCFETDSGQAWRLDAATGRVLGRWRWPIAKASLDARDTGGGPTVTLRYGSSGHPAWQRFTAYLDTRTMKFTGLSEPSPLAGIEWENR